MSSSPKPNVTDFVMSQGNEKTILFGSSAYGVPDDDSDLDIIVFTNSTNQD